MKIKLECSDKNRPILENLLQSQGLSFDDNASFIIRENSIREDNIKENKLSGNQTSVLLSFDPENPAALLSFISEMKGLNKADKKESLDSSEQSSEILLGRNGDCYEVMKVVEIFYFFAEGDFIFCRTKTGSFEVKKKLYQLEEDFGSRGFIRISKSIIINILTISEVVPWFGGRLLLRIDVLKEKLEVSRSYVKSFKSYLGM